MSHLAPRSSLFQRFPLLFPVTCLAGGIGVSKQTCHSIHCGAWLCMAFVLMLLWLLLIFRKRNGTALSVRDVIKSESINRRFCFLLSLVSIFCTGGALGTMALESDSIVWPSYRREWNARIVSVNKLYADACQADVEIENDPVYRGKKIRIYLQGSLANHLETGQPINFCTRVKVPQNLGNPEEFDHSFYLQTHGISGTSWCDSLSWRPTTAAIPYNSFTPRIVLRNVRNLLSRKYHEHFYGNSLAVISALTIGDKSLLDAPIRQLYAEAGASHVLALSGLHLGILFGVYLGIMQRWFRRRGSLIAASLLGMIALWAFVLMSGESISLVRAATMMTLLLAFNCLRQQLLLMHSICLCALVMLLFSPLSVFDTGFQLSFVAITGIALFNETVRPHVALLQEDEDERKFAPKRTSYISRAIWFKHLCYYHLHCFANRLKRRITEMVCISFSAQLFTLPLVVYHFHILAIYGVVSSFFVIPLATGILWFSILFFMLPFAQSFIAGILQVLIDVLQHGLQIIAGFPAASLSVYPSTPVLFMASVAVLALIRWLLLRRVRSLQVLIVSMGCTICLSVYDYRPNRLPPQIQVYNTGRTTIVHFVSAASKSYLLSSVRSDSTQEALRFIRRGFWQRYHMTPPTLLPSKFRNTEICRENDVIAFGNTHVTWMHSRISGNSSTMVPFVTDLLVLSRGCPYSVLEILSRVRPRRVVLTTSIPQKQARILEKEFTEQGIPTTVGAFCLKLPTAP